MGKHENARVWDMDETEQLLELLERGGTKWKSHAGVLGRSPSSLRNKYKRIARSKYVKGVNKRLRCGALRAGHVCRVPEEATIQVDFSMCLPTEEADIGQII
eukprot:1599649-Prymnesium_polylepis.1